MNIKQKFSRGIFVALVGGLSFLGGWFFNEYSNREVLPNEITTRKIEGAKISHKAWNLKGKSIRFITESDGKGKAETVVPKKVIPEARKWMERNNVIIGGASLIYSEGTFYPGGKLEYYRRFGSFGVGGGTMVSRKSVSLSFGIFVMF